MCVEEAAEAWPLWPLLFALTIAMAGATPPSTIASRMYQYDVHAVARGCRAAAVNLEARSIGGRSASRHCAVVRLERLTVDRFVEIASGAGALLAMLPKSPGALAPEERRNLLALESAMLAREASVPVYFVAWSARLEAAIDDLSDESDSESIPGAGSAFDALADSALANGYQIAISAPAIRKLESKVAALHGRLAGGESAARSSDAGDASGPPTVAIVAHYDSAAVAPELAFGADSNASGVSVLLELARIFSRLYSSRSTRGPVNLVFLLTGAAHMNYYSTKKWIEDRLDSVDGSAMRDAAFVLCLDSLASERSVVMHVSKPPKEGSPTDAFYDRLKQAAASRGLVDVEGVHKKINLADENLAWEHERFSIRRLPAFTLSALRSHKSSIRSSILDNYDSVDVKNLVANAQVIADALAGYVYDVSASDYDATFSDSLKVDESSIDSWMRYLTSQPRATHFVSRSPSAVVAALTDALGKYLPDVTVSHYVPDKRDPEFVAYAPTSAPLNVYNVKPAVFDLILTVVIAAYLGAVYLFIYKFPTVYSQICRATRNGGAKSFKTQ